MQESKMKTYTDFINLQRRYTMDNLSQRMLASPEKLNVPSNITLNYYLTEGTKPPGEMLNRYWSNTIVDEIHQDIEISHIGVPKHTLVNYFLEDLRISFIGEGMSITAILTGLAIKF